MCNVLQTNVRLRGAFILIFRYDSPFDVYISLLSQNIKMSAYPIHRDVAFQFQFPMSSHICIFSAHCVALLFFFIHVSNNQNLIYFLLTFHILCMCQMSINNLPIFFGIMNHLTIAFGPVIQ